MQTARVTILMSPSKKAAFDAVAAERGQSVGEFFRQAGDRFADDGEAEKEAELEVLARELEQAIPQMREDIDAMRQSIRDARQAVAAYRAEKDAARKIDVQAAAA